MDQHQAKREMRERLLAARRAMPAAERTAAGSALRDAVLALPGITMGGTVCAYHSIGTEPPTHKLVAALWKHGVYVLLPVVLADGSLDWAAYEGPDSLTPADHGLLEPMGQRYGAEAVHRAAAVICPALAVDHGGVRLGRGAGYYDRALARVGPNTLTLAAVYDDEFVDTVPAEPHDQPVGAVVTPGGGVRRLAPQ
ncbi:5-formyltetrahydrofolate cyclo-ligase [Salinactinospora qingdaonensis]|uniref:5-formyltetrahydrofolate cyclo-ligase n=1 Tax=Salinactinospora qingdaonensis TaxID=702744 RepID=A0ABP7FM57_9ACTN